MNPPVDSGAWVLNGRCWPFAVLFMEIPCASDPVCRLASPWARPGSLPSRSSYQASAITEPPPRSRPPRPPPPRSSPIPLTHHRDQPLRRQPKGQQDQCLFRQRPWQREQAVLHDRGGRERRPAGPDGRGRAGGLHRHHDLRLGNRAGPNHIDAIGAVTVEAISSGATLTISGAHNVVLDGFSAVGTQRSFYVTDGSSDITINGGFGDDQSGSTASIEVDGTTSDIIVSRMAVEARNPIEVDPGAVRGGHHRQLHPA